MYEQPITPRQLSARKAVVTKMLKLWAFIDGAPIEVNLCDKSYVLKRAIYHWNRRRAERERFDLEEATVDCSQDFLDKICVNYLRHNQSNYHYILKQIKGKVGINEAYLRLRRRIFGEIARVYPWLQTECERQRDVREEERKN